MLCGPCGKFPIIHLVVHCFMCRHCAANTTVHVCYVLDILSAETAGEFTVITDGRQAGNMADCHKPRLITPSNTPLFNRLNVPPSVIHTVYTSNLLILHCSHSTYTVLRMNRRNRETIEHCTEPLKCYTGILCL